MRGSPSRVGVTLVVAAVMVVSSLGLIGLVAVAAPSPSTAPSGASAAVGSSALAALPTMASADRAGPVATPSEVATSQQVGHIAPLYGSTPAPIGLAEYGLRSGPSGELEPFILNTTSLQATFDPSAFGAPNATDLLNAQPDGYGVQLNAVVTNVTLFGNDSYEFWTQDVVNYYPYIDTMVLQTNVWNWSAGSGGTYLSPNALYAHGPDGSQGSSVYAAVLTETSVAYPFNLTLTMSSGLSEGRDAVYFSVHVTSPAGTVNEPDWDYVVFNSRAAGAPGLTSPANYTADGYQYNAVGSTNDFELTLGGASDGRQTSFLSANATETLDYWNASRGAYEAIPSAFDFGSETGETSIGDTMSWATGSNGQPYGIMTTGPALLGGLWNASSPAGGPAHLAVHVQPTNAFVFLSYGASSAFNVSEPEWAPTVHTDAFTLPAGTYTLEVEEADYDRAFVDNFTLAPGGSLTLTENLARNMSMGIYTPLWAWTNAQIANLSTSGSGSPADPYEIVNNQLGAIPFLQFNNLGYLVFPGVFFLGTSAYTVFDDPPSLQAFDPAYSNIPSTDLPWWFYDDANIAVVNATSISGWFIETPVSGPNTSSQLSVNVIVENSTGFLFANDHFDTQASALALIGGGNNVVWGNTFTQLEPPFGLPFGPVPFSAGIGVAVFENGDTIYNNRFTNIPTPAISPPVDLYTETVIPIPYSDTWNITPQAASVVHYASNWPYDPLYGSIIGTATQGGNFWWDYGMNRSQWGQSNPYSRLPYTSGGEIASGGDYAPLLYTPLYPIRLVPEGLPGDLRWMFSVSGSGQFADTYYSNASVPGGTTVVIELTGAPVSQYFVTTAVLSGGYNFPQVEVNVNGSATVLIHFVAYYTVKFTATGLPSRADWAVSLNHTQISSSVPTISFQEVNGSYPFEVLPPAGYAADPMAGFANVSGSDLNETIALGFLYNVTFSESGLPTGTNWSVTVGSQVRTSLSTTVVFSEVNGSYSFVIGSIGPWYAQPYSNGSFMVSGAPLAVAVPFAFTSAVTFSQTGIPNGTRWTIQVTLGSLAALLSGSGTSWTENVTGPSAVFQLANGTYTYSLSSPGYQTQTGNLTANGMPQTVSVTTSPTGSASGTTFGGWLWVILGVVVAAVVIVVVVLLVRRRRSTP